MGSVTLDDKQMDLLKKTRDLLEELIETLEITEDAELTQAIREGEKDAKAKRVRRYEEFVEELKASDEI